MTTIQKIEKGIITLAEFSEDQQSFIRGLVKLSYNEGLENIEILYNCTICDIEINYKGICETCYTKEGISAC